MAKWKANNIMKRNEEHTLARERSHQRHQHTNTGHAKALRGTKVERKGVVWEKEDMGCTERDCQAPVGSRPQRESSPEIGGQASTRSAQIQPEISQIGRTAKRQEHGHSHGHGVFILRHKTQGHRMERECKLRPTVGRSIHRGPVLRPWRADAEPADTGVVVEA